MFKLLLSCIVIIISFYSTSVLSDIFVAGPLELKPINSSIVIEKVRARNPPAVFINTTFKFVIKNRSSSDIRIILISKNIDAYDNLNQKVFKDPNSLQSSGLPLSTIGDNKEIFIKDKDKFVSLSPGQQIQVFVGSKDRGGVIVEDLSGDFYKTHRPSSITFNGSIGVLNVDGSSDVRTFSFADVPVSISNR